MNHRLTIKIAHPDPGGPPGSETSIKVRTQPRDLTPAHVANLQADIASLLVKHGLEVLPDGK